MTGSFETFLLIAMEVDLKFSNQTMNAAQKNYTVETKEILGIGGRAEGMHECTQRN